MKFDKKCVGDIGFNVMVVGIIAAISIFGFLFVKYMFAEEILPPIAEQSLIIVEQYGNDTSVYNMINQQLTNYNNLDYQIDLLFLIVWIGTTIIGAIAAYYTPKLNKLQLFLFLFIGIIILLVLYNYLYQILSWIVEEFINNVYSASDTYLPIFSYYVENYIMIGIITLVVYLTINQFNRREEQTLLSEEVEESSFQPSTEEQGGLE